MFPSLAPTSFFSIICRVVTRRAFAVCVILATAFLLGFVTFTAESISTQAIYQFIPVTFFYFYPVSTISTGHRVFVNVMKREFLNFFIDVGPQFSWPVGQTECFRDDVFVADDRATEWARRPRGPSG